MGILTDSVVIAYKSPIVIARRMLVFARGGKPARGEARRAVTEKAGLASSSVVSLVTGHSLGSVVKRYRQKVEANAQRLK